MAAQAGIEYATNGRGKFANDFNGAKTTLRSQSRRFGNLGSTVHHWAVNERVMSATPSASPSPTAPASGELLCRLRYPRRVRVGHHGDQVRHRGDRPHQANRDHDGDYPCKHLHPLCVALSLAIEGPARM